MTHFHAKNALSVFLCLLTNLKDMRSIEDFMKSVLIQAFAIVELRRTMTERQMERYAWIVKFLREKRDLEKKTSLI